MPRVESNVNLVNTCCLATTELLKRCQSSRWQSNTRPAFRRSGALITEPQETRSADGIPFLNEEPNPTAVTKAVGSIPTLNSNTSLAVPSPVAKKASFNSFIRGCIPSLTLLTVGSKIFCAQRTLPIHLPSLFTLRNLLVAVSFGFRPAGVPAFVNCFSDPFKQSFTCWHFQTYILI